MLRPLSVNIAALYCPMESAPFYCFKFLFAQLNSDVTVLNTKLTGLFVTANLSVGYTLDSWGVADVTLPFSPPGGYSFFCVNRIDTDDIRPVALTSYYQSGNNLIVGLCNCSAQSISGTLVATNVYLKSDFWGSL